jgi:hypothetical protein
MRDQERKAVAMLMQYLGGFELALEEQGSDIFVKEGIEDMERCLERVSNIDDLDSGAPLRPDSKAFAGIARTYRGIFETCSSFGAKISTVHKGAALVSERLLQTLLSICELEIQRASEVRIGG